MFLKKLRIKLYHWRIKFERDNLLKRLIKYSNSIELDPEKKEVYNYIRTNGLKVFPYSFTEKIDEKELMVKSFSSFPYVEHFKRELYFPKEWNQNKVKRYYKSLLIEQLPESPHCYCNEKFQIENNEILVDVGAAEGNFTIENIEKVKKVYLFEKNKIWIEPLNLTFEPYKDKIEIVQKYVGKENKGDFISLNSIEELKSNPIFIKIDVDGAEREVLSGMENIFEYNKNVKVAICTYHNQNDANEFEEYFQKRGFKTSFSKGYMLFYYDKKIAPPYLRKGVLRAYKD